MRMVIDDLGVEPLEPDRDKLAQRLAAADAVLRASFAWQIHSEKRPVGKPAGGS
jgi:hypothetical protein